ncbi:MAG: DUF1289 domain-containing protein [Pseudomonadota bacterium]
MTVELNATQSIAERAVLAVAVAENVPSPCVSVCRMDPQRTYCEGCLRSIDEIRVWRASSDLEKKAIWARIAERAAALSPTAP